VIVTTDAAAGFNAETLKEKTFNLVPGFEAVVFIVALEPGSEARMQLRAETGQPVKERGLHGVRPDQQLT